MLNRSPETVIREAALGKETVNVWVPFQRPAEGMEDTDETGDKVSAFIDLMEQSEDDAANRLKKTVKEGTVIQKERAEFFVNSKDEMSVCAVNEFKGHICRAVNAVFAATSGAEFRMATERDEFEFAAVEAAVHGAAVRRIPTVDHLFHVLHNNRTWVEDIFDFLIVFFKNLLKDVHKSIMKELGTESNPPLKD